MLTINSFKKEVLGLEKSHFEKLALKIFQFQASHNPIYRKYLNLISKNYTQISSLKEIPFLPIEFFKRHRVHTENWHSEKRFLSSGTTGSIRSVHEVQDLSFYHDISSAIFAKTYSEIKKTAFLALLPSYLEQGNSSLVEMLKHFISKSNFNESGFYLDDHKKLISTVESLKKRGITTVLFGVTYALLDLIENCKVDFSGINVIETGGMKGRRTELSKDEVLRILSKGMNIDHINSEYGMTELLSQAYSKKKGVFSQSLSMKVLVRDINDPFSYVSNGKTGGINIIDLANIHSCCFIETKDIGVKFDNEDFKILGRLDNSDIRGCNLLVN